MGGGGGAMEAPIAVLGVRAGGSFRRDQQSVTTKIGANVARQSAVLQGVAVLQLSNFWSLGLGSRTGLTHGTGPASEAAGLQGHAPFNASLGSTRGLQSEHSHHCHGDSKCGAPGLARGRDRRCAVMRHRYASASGARPGPGGAAGPGPCMRHPPAPPPPEF